MCGFAGALKRDVTAEQWTDRLTAMGDAIRHRGPDDAGQWTDPAAGVGLSHRRLSILDLSPAGHQPMISRSGRYVIAYNGEVYNYEQVRTELDGPWRGHSDTEVLLAAIEAWGVEQALQRFVGMFALAVWDRSERVLILARDRVGIKPLYYGWSGGAFLFGSEIKALRAHPGFDAAVDPDAIALLLRYNYIPAPHAIYRGLRKLEAGRVLRVPVDRALDPTAVRSESYWSFEQIARQGQREGTTDDERQCLEQLDATLRDAVRLRMVSDVPLGAFLSGGIDSSLVVALMQAQSTERVKTFSIGFNEEEYDEARHARAVAEHLGTDHTELYVTPQDALDVIPALPTMFDEPFSDPSQIPTFLVSELARRHVTVSLSGDGGDELFAGYRRYAAGRDLWRRLERMPSWMRHLGAGSLRACPKPVLDGAFFWLAAYLSRYGSPGSAGDKLKTLADILSHDEPQGLYRDLISHWKRPTEIVRSASEPATPLEDPGCWADLPDLTHRMMLADGLTYLPDDILVKVDRTSMAVSLEARVPILDHRVVELAWKLPLSMKVRDGQGKWALKQVLERYVPRRLFERPKMGFGVPIDSWLRGPLRDWAESLLDRRRLMEEGVFHPDPIRTKWEEHLSGRRRWHYYLWDVLMFQAWQEAARDGAPALAGASITGTGSGG